MRPDPVIRRARASDIDAMLPNVRTKDAIDVMTAKRGSVAAAMQQSLARADASWVWEVDGQPILLWGITLRSVVTGGALVWIFSTNQIELHRRDFWQGSKTVLAVLLERYGAVEGYCDGRFLQSMQWLRKLGFALGEPLEVAGVPFHHFEMVSHDRR